MAWRWHEEWSMGDAPSGRYGHSAVSIDADHVLVVGGKTGARGTMQVHLLHQDVERGGRLGWQQLNISSTADFLLAGETVKQMTQRWAMAACFVKEKQMVFLNGGFDSEYNYGDTWLLKPLQTPASASAGDGSAVPFLDNLRSLCWYRDRNIPPRAYHTAVADGSVVYAFGGQCCVGGPYDYYNVLLTFDFSNGPTEISSLRMTGPGPSNRSQCSSVIYNNAIYILFGYTETETKADVYKLDLSTKQWEEVVMEGPVPQCCQMRGLIPQPFRVHSAYRPCVQFDHRIIVLHPTNSRHPEEIGKKQTLSEINLKSKKWRLLQIGQEAGCNVSSRGNATMNLLGDRLVVLGGHSLHSSTNRITFDNVLCAELPKRLSWDCEKVLWIGHRKETARDCVLARVPPEIICYVLSFVNSQVYL